MNRPPAIAVIGTGAFGALHARTLAALPEARLTALVNRTPEKAAALARELGVAAICGTLAEVIDRRLADAVVIATNTATHVPLALEALAAGLHVLVEKPVGATLAEVELLAGAARASGRVAMAGHVCIFHSLVSPLVERARREGFRSAHFVRHRPAGIVEMFSDEHPITLTMVHDLAVAAQLAGGAEPEEFSAWQSVGPHGRPDQSWALLRWADGRVATFHSHWTLPPGAPSDGFDRMEVFGDGYHTAVNTNPQPWTWASDRMHWPVALEMSSVDGRPTGMLVEELRSFLAACGGAPVPGGCRMEDAVTLERWMQRLLETARRPC
jgi:predicted dehydrogenase